MCNGDNCFLVGEYFSVDFTVEVFVEVGFTESLAVDFDGFFLSVTGFEAMSFRSVYLLIQTVANLKRIKI